MSKIDRKFTHNEELVQTFVNTYAALKRVLHRTLHLSHEDKMATILQYQALAYLRDHANATVGELAKQLDMSSSAVAQLIDRLLDAGRIMRKNDESDRRIVHISLTAEGKKELARIQKTHSEKMNYVLSHISERDLKELIRIQTEMITKLEQSL